MGILSTDAKPQIGQVSSDSRIGEPSMTGSRADSLGPGVGTMLGQLRTEPAVHRRQQVQVGRFE